MIKKLVLGGNGKKLYYLIVCILNELRLPALKLPTGLLLALSDPARRKTHNPTRVMLSPMIEFALKMLSGKDHTRQPK